MDPLTLPVSPATPCPAVQRAARCWPGVWLRALLCAFGVAAAVPLAHAADPAVLVVISERSASYVEAADALAAELERGGLPRGEIALMTSGEYSAAAAATPKLLVAVGTGAANLLAAKDSRIPLIATLLPPSSFEQIVQASGRKPSAVFSAVYLSQPFSRQLDLVRLALPDARRVGVLWGPESQAQASALQAATQARGLQLVAAQIGPGESAYPPLQKVLEDADLLLALPNPQIYNSSSIQNILLSSYRSRVPFVGFSASYVQAGAVFAVYSTPAMIGRQTAVMARNLLQGRGLPATPQYPLEFSVGVNEQVARSLGLKLDATALGERLRQTERAP